MGLVYGIEDLALSKIDCFDGGDISSCICNSHPFRACRGSYIQDNVCYAQSDGNNLVIAQAVCLKGSTHDFNHDIYIFDETFNGTD